jgi:EAL domain-containing protein (putative c-di-GMP-specific phosphodiesterase class I)
VATPERQEALIAMLRDQRVDPDLFRLELAETTAMDVAPGVDEMRTVSQRLMEELGIRLLVDDFGSGLSNYRRLCEAWYDAIKLDLELVRGISTSLRLQTFVGSLIEAVHGLGNTVVAEGVEQHRDLETLLRLGVDAVQGYLIAPALRWSEVPGWIWVFCRPSGPGLHAPMLSSLLLSGLPPSRMQLRAVCRSSAMCWSTGPICAALRRCYCSTCRSCGVGGWM